MTFTENMLHSSSKYQSNVIYPISIRPSLPKEKDLLFELLLKENETY